MLLKDLFGSDVDDIKNINPMMDELPELSTEISQQTRCVVKYFQQQIKVSYPNYTGVYIIRKTIDPAEFLFKELLMEGRARKCCKRLSTGQVSLNI